MQQLIPYLVYPGNCKEAMQFYASCLHGEITILQTFGESPIDVPAEVADRIFNAEVKAGNITLKASDDMPGHEVKQGTSVSLYLVFDDKDAKKVAFDKLADGGKILFPLKDDFGMLKDKFGVQWMVVHKA
ncbi:MAG: VOC family protein [Bacteroidota bacterium]